MKSKINTLLIWIKMGIRDNEGEFCFYNFKIITFLDLENWKKNSDCENQKENILELRHYCKMFVLQKKYKISDLENRKENFENVGPTK